MLSEPIGTPCMEGQLLAPENPCLKALSSGQIPVQKYDRLKAQSTKAFGEELKPTTDSSPSINIPGPSVFRRDNFEARCATLAPGVLLWGESPIVLSGSWHNNTSLFCFLPFPDSLPKCLFGIFGNYLPNKLLALRSLSQDLFLE